MRKKRAKHLKFTVGLLGLASAVLFAVFLSSRDFAILAPKGVIAEQQRDLLIFATILSLVIILPVFWLTFHIVRTYRVGSKKKAKYQPDYDGSKLLESLWWGIPSAIILVLSVITWQTSHSLDPYRPIASDKTPLTVQVIAMQWKWLFLYPEQRIATVNYVQMPVDRPIRFDITADAPMNSFWIPQLGGQIYAMTGMNSNLHLQASEVGTYRGSSANLSGEGFAGMNFEAHVSSQAEFDAWAKTARTGNGPMNMTTYQELAVPSQNTPAATYRLADSSLYDTVIAKYMSHGAGH